MINIPNFDKEFVGRKFKTGLGTVYTIIGYGDNGSNGNPYLVGLHDDNGRVTARTERFKDIEILPATAT